MEVRLIKPEEAVAYLKISAASFIWKFNKDEDKDVEIPVMGAFHNGKLVAGVELFDFKCNYCGNLIDTLVLSGVCSQPEYRGMGAVRAIFDEVGRTAVEKGIRQAFLRRFQSHITRNSALQISTVFSQSKCLFAISDTFRTVMTLNSIRENSLRSCASFTTSAFSRKTL